MLTNDERIRYAQLLTVPVPDQGQLEEIEYLTAKNGTQSASDAPQEALTGDDILPAMLRNQAC